MEHEVNTEKSNILFIAVDDLNDWIGVLGGHPQTKTPHIDRLARQGLLFTNAHTPAPLCGPSRGATFTGLSPSTTKFYANAQVDEQSPRNRHVTIPEHFRSCGYHARGAGKLFHPTGNAYPDGFDEYGTGVDAKGGPFTKQEMQTSYQNPVRNVDHGPYGLQADLPLNCLPDDRRPFRKHDNSFDWGEVDVSDDEMEDSATAAWGIRQLREGLPEPFFLGVGFFRPHQPLYAPSHYFESFSPGKVVLPEVPYDALNDLPRTGVDYAVLPNTGGMHRTVVRYGQWEAAVTAYLACVQFLDTQIGRVLNALQESNYADNTAVALWSDHGYHLGQQHHWGKWAGWEQSTHVPLIIAPAKNDTRSNTHNNDHLSIGRHCDAPVSLIDLFPTLTDLCGIEPPPSDIDGQSLFPFLQDPDSRRNAPALTTFGPGNHAVRTRRWRLIRYFDGSSELYDHYSDPGEHRNLASHPDYADVRKRFARHLPEDEHVDHFVRYGPWQAIFYKDERAPELFNIGTGRGLNHYINNTESWGNKHPDVLRRIQKQLEKLSNAPKRMSLSQA